MAVKKGRAEFLAAHDPETKSRKAIDQVLAQMLKEGKDRFEYESDFRAMTGLAPAQLSAVRDRYTKHIVVAGGGNGRKSHKLVWCATASFATECAKVPGNKPYTAE